MFGLFARPVSFRAQLGQQGHPHVELANVEEGREKQALQAFKGMGRLRIRSKSNDFGHVTIEFTAGFESYRLHGTAGKVFIRSEGDGAAIGKMLAFMRKSRRFRELKA